MIVGQTVTRKSDRSRWTISAYDEAQAAYTLAPVEFGPSIAVPADALRASFSGVQGTNPAATDEVGGWKKFGAHFERAINRQRAGRNGLLTPEDVLAGRARERAEQIAADPEAMADFAVGLLPVAKEVAAVLDEIVAAEEADADRPRRRTEPPEDAVTTAEARSRLGHK